MARACKAAGTGAPQSHKRAQQPSTSFRTDLREYGSGSPFSATFLSNGPVDFETPVLNALHFRNIDERRTAILDAH